MSTQKNKIKDPTKAKRRVNNILAEAEICSRLGWNIEFLSGGYKSFTTAEIKSIAENIHSITGDGVWLNTGITSELDEYGSEMLKLQIRSFKRMFAQASHWIKSVICWIRQETWDSKKRLQ